MAGKEQEIKNVINSAVNFSAEQGVKNGAVLTDWLGVLFVIAILAIFIVIGINVIFDSVKQQKEEGEGIREVSKAMVYSIIAIVGVLSFIMMVRY